MNLPIEPSFGNLPTTPGVVANAGPVTFPFVAMYFDMPGPAAEGQYHQVLTTNFAYYDTGANNDVIIYGGEVYCGLARMVTVTDPLEVSTGQVFLNLDNLHTSSPTGELSDTSGGQVSLLLYNITNDTITDYRHRMILPLYS